MAQMAETHVLFSESTTAPLSDDIHDVVVPIAGAENSSKAPYAHYYRQYADAYDRSQYMHMSSRRTYAGSKYERK